MAPSLLWNLSLPICKVGMTFAPPVLLSGLHTLSEGLPLSRGPGNVSKERTLWE